MLGPIQADKEMNQDLPGLLKKLTAIPEYRSRFAEAFPKGRALNERNLARALATFVRGIVSSTSAFDRWVDETRPLSTSPRSAASWFSTKPVASVATTLDFHRG